MIEQNKKWDALRRFLDNNLCQNESSNNDITQGLSL